jgi:hypothetical protein
MKKISAEDFRYAVQFDPAWASKLTEPTLIEGMCILDKSPITHLSPHLRFRDHVSLLLCKELKVLEGGFDDWSNFESSGIESVGDAKFFQSGPSPWLVCDLTGTPLSNKDPVKAAEIMTASCDPKVWEEINQDPETTESTEACLKEAIKVVRKQRTMKTLRTQGKALEI